MRSASPADMRERAAFDVVSNPNLIVLDMQVLPASLSHNGASVAVGLKLGRDARSLESLAKLGVVTALLQPHPSLSLCCNASTLGTFCSSCLFDSHTGSMPFHCHPSVPYEADDTEVLVSDACRQGTLV